MVQKKIFKQLFFLTLLIFLGCHSSKIKLDSTISDIDNARTIAITHFLNKNIKHSNALVNDLSNKSKKIYRIASDSSKMFYHFSILEVLDSHFILRLHDSLGKVPKSYFPNNVKIINDIAFVWKDNVTPLTQETISMLIKYKKIDSTDIKRHLGLVIKKEDYGTLILGHGGIVGCYDFCKNNIFKNKKRIEVNNCKSPRMKCP